MSRIQALLAAGALTGLVIVAFMWYATSDTASAFTSAVTSTITSDVTATPANITAADKTTAPDLQLLLEQNRQLRETVTTLLNREGEYRQQIEVANQKLLAAQEQTSSGGLGSGRLFQDDDHEEKDHNGDHDGDHDGDEHEQHERNEHEEFEHQGHGEDD